MDRELFVKQIQLIQQLNIKTDQLKDIGINIIESPLYDIPAKLFDNFIETVCTDDGVDLVFWWLYEDVDKVICENIGEAEEQKISLDTVYQLYEYLEKNKYFVI